MKDDDDTMCYRSELEAAVKAEREACARVCEENGRLFADSGLIGVCIANAGAIRARGQE